MDAAGVAFLRPVNLDPVAAFFLGFVAAGVGEAQHAAQVACFLRDRHEPDADAYAEGLVLPYEAKFADGLAHGMSDPQRLFERACLEQRAELIAPEARERIAAAHA